uniref:Paired domain-containing protein n=1 Tax=Acrobeloides nanus TaxID=290746 RepID=A0A914C4S9_9BILA
MKELRGGIIRLIEEGKNANQIDTAMNLDRMTVGRIIHRYQENGSYEDRHRSGRPRTARTPANKRKIKGRIQRNQNSRKNFIRKMAKAVGVSHKAEETQNLIRDNVPEFIEVDISSKRNNGDWPPNSPFSIWSILEAEACSKPHHSIEALKKSLVASWNKIPQDVIDRAVDDFPKRLQKCIDAQGGHFENK